MLRTVVIENPGHLFVRNRQLMLRRESTEYHVGSFEDIGWLLLEHPQLTITQAVMAHAAEENTVVIFCNGQFQPVSLASPLEGNTLQGERVRWQLECSAPRKKQLWKYLVQQKIWNQAELLRLLNKDDEAVRYLVKKVKSGDPDNVEAIAARRYWPALMGQDFRRHRDGTLPNGLLNYGYSILRSCANRMLVGTGLNPGISVFHSNKYNAFGLADDLMEVYRPWVDRIVWSLHFEHGLDSSELDSHLKKELLEVLQHDCWHDGEIKPLSQSMKLMAIEIGQYFGGKIEKIRTVKIIDLNHHEVTWNGLEMD